MSALFFLSRFIYINPKEDFPSVQLFLNHILANWLKQFHEHLTTRKDLKLQEDVASSINIIWKNSKF